MSAPTNSTGWPQTPTPTQLFRSVVLLGAPGSGKGTQGSILRNVPGFYHCSTGEVFRRLDAGTPLGKLFLQYSSRGELVPDEIVLQVWLANIHAHSVLGDFRPDKHLLVLDGLPRTVHQADLLRQYLDVRAVIHLDGGDTEAMLERLRNRALKEGRPDDADEKVIRNRFAVYQRETQPLLAFYPPELVIHIDGSVSPVRVAAQILLALAPLQERLETGLTGG
jgi:adenylate kinase